MADEQTPLVPPASVPVGGQVTTQEGTKQTFASASASMPEDGSKPTWLPAEIEWPEGGLQGEALDSAIQAHFKAKEKADPAAGEEQPVKTAEEIAAEEAAKAKEPKQEDQEDKPKDAPAERTDDEIRASLKEAGGIYANPEYEPFAITFERKGDLTPEERTQASEKLGVPLDAVNSFVDLQKQARAVMAENATLKTSQAEAISGTQKNELFAVTGGGENYGKFAEWAKEGLTDAQKATYDKADHATAKELLAGYYARFQQAGGGDGGRDLTAEGDVLSESQDKQGQVKPYASTAEQLADQNDPRYDKDPGFRAKVIARIGATK